MQAAGRIALMTLGIAAASAPGNAAEDICVDCLSVRVGPPMIVRGPFPDELDATFNALKLPDGSMRGFTANGATYAVDGVSLMDMGGPRRAVLEPGQAGSVNECGSWLTSTARVDGALLGLVHQERACDYGQGRTNKSMAISTSADDGLTWSDLKTVITGTDTPQPDRITGEGDCTMLDGQDGYLYAYCLRNSDWQTIVARAEVNDPTNWRKYFDGKWSEPGLGGQATAIGFLGPGSGYLKQPGWVAAIATDPWFGGVRLSLSSDKVSFVDLDEPLAPIDGSDWARPAATDLVAYGTVINPDDGSNLIDWHFQLAYIYVPANKGFESRYLVLQDVAITAEDAPVPVQVGTAMTRWTNADATAYVTSGGPLTGDQQGFRLDTTVAYLMTRAPEGAESVKLAECSSTGDQIIG